MSPHSEGLPHPNSVYLLSPFQLHV